MNFSHLFIHILRIHFSSLINSHTCSGESLLNDGSAIVFFTIFKNIFLYEQGIHGGKDYSIGEGIEIFAKMSLGAVAIGIAFGLGLVAVLFLLNRR